MPDVLNAVDFDEVVATITERWGHPPTAYQVAIYKFILEQEGNLSVLAVAGSGKTTSLEQTMLFIEERLRVLMCAFNKHIANELSARIDVPNVRCATLNGAGHGAVCRGTSGTIELEKSKSFDVLKTLTRYEERTEEQREILREIYGPAAKMMGLMKAHGYGSDRLTVLHGYPEEPLLLSLAAKYGIDLPENWDMFSKVLKAAYSESLAMRNTIDFDDQLLFPIAYDLPLGSYDLVFVDESQDLNPIQIEMVRRLTQRGGRAVFVGDRNQAIYGFRGADPYAMDSIGRIFQTTELPLSICWRCAKKIVAEAKVLVPQIEAAPNAPEGIVEHIPHEEYERTVQAGDLVLCRTTAPLVQRCLDMVRDGRKAYVLGRDIGRKLGVHLDKVRKKTKKTIDDPCDRISLYFSGEMKKLDPEKQEMELQSLQDTCSTLLILARGCDTIKDVYKRIDEVFSDQPGVGIKFCTAHKAKGLENDRVFILRPDLMPHPMARQPWERIQERNLRYVAITRAKTELYYVQKEANEK